MAEAQTYRIETATDNSRRMGSVRARGGFGSEWKSADVAACLKLHMIPVSLLGFVDFG
jgi:hypothetical protein